MSTSTCTRCGGVYEPGPGGSANYCTPCLTRLRQLHARMLLQGPMPPDCLRLQVWLQADGRFDGVSSINVDGLSIERGVEVCAVLRQIAGQIEQGIAEVLARHKGVDAAAFRLGVAELADRRAPSDQVVTVRIVPGERSEAP